MSEECGARYKLHRKIARIGSAKRRHDELPSGYLLSRNSSGVTLSPRRQSWRSGEIARNVADAREVDHRDYSRLIATLPCAIIEEISFIYSEIVISFTSLSYMF